MGSSRIYLCFRLAPGDSGYAHRKLRDLCFRLAPGDPGYAQGEAHACPVGPSYSLFHPAWGTCNLVTHEWNGTCDLLFTFSRSLLFCGVVLGVWWGGSSAQTWPEVREWHVPLCWHPYFSLLPRACACPVVPWKAPSLELQAVCQADMVAGDRPAPWVMMMVMVMMINCSHISIMC